MAAKKMQMIHEGYWRRDHREGHEVGLGRGRSEVLDQENGHCR